MKSTYNYIEDYLIEIQSKGRYAVTLEELRNKFITSEKAILQNIYRLKSKNQLAQVRKKFYVIVPPQYSNRGMVPATLFIDDLMKFLKRDYYVGLLSAAALHGAAHQQPMEFQVIIKKPPLRKIQNKKLNIVFFTKGQWELENITDKKTETGFIKVSSPSLTAFDLINHNKKIGGLNRILPIIEDLNESITPAELGKTAKSQKTPNIQRLGYLLDKLGCDQLALSLFKNIKDKKLKEVRLSLAHSNRKGEFNSKWNLNINTELDI